MNAALAKQAQKIAEQMSRKVTGGAGMAELFLSEAYDLVLGTEAVAQKEASKPRWIKTERGWKRA